MQRLRTSGATQPIGASTLVQAATVGQCVRDFLFDAFLHVARHEGPRLPPPNANARPPPGDRVWVLTIDWGRRLVGHPYPERLTFTGRTRYHEPDMADPLPSTTQTNTMGGKGEHGSTPWPP